MTRIAPCVLIVEDDPMIAWDLQETILEMGCRVVGPALGLEAGYLAAGEATFDFALLDFDLGRGNNSLTIAEKLNERGIGYAFITSSNPQDIAATLPLARVIPKPIHRAELAKLLTAA